MLHIACIDNIAAAGYRILDPTWPATWHYGTPSEVYTTVTLGACDAALLPIGGYTELAHLLEPIGQFGIGCAGAVQSVQVFGRMPIPALVRSRQPIFATPKSKTSRKLLTTLCRLEFGEPPTLTDNTGSAEGMLFIGAEALRHSRLEPGWPARRDLGQWWHERTGLPFVFARWVVRRDLPEQDRQMVLSWLSDSVAHCATPAGQSALRERMVSEGFPASLSAPYYRGIQYALSPKHLSGEREFLNLQEEPSAWVAGV